MVETKPIMVTEIDWSPEDPDKASEGHYNEWGQWTQPNLGSWATASTSKWGYGMEGSARPLRQYRNDDYPSTGILRH